MCKKTNDYYHHSLEYVPDCYMTQEMYKEAVGTCPFMLQCVTNCYKAKEMFEIGVSKEPFMSTSVYNH